MKLIFNINSIFYIDFLLHINCNYCYRNKYSIHWYNQFKFRQRALIKKYNYSFRQIYYICG